MKLKGHRENYFSEPKNHETTRDERLLVITLRKYTEKSWKEIAIITKVNKSSTSLPVGKSGLDTL